MRLGLAACYFRLGNTSKAAAAYERVLDLDPACTQALLGLAVIRLSINADAEVWRHLYCGGAGLVGWQSVWVGG